VNALLATISIICLHPHHGKTLFNPQIGWRRGGQLWHQCVRHFFIVLQTSLRNHETTASPDHVHAETFGALAETHARVPPITGMRMPSNASWIERRLRSVAAEGA